MEVVLVRHAIAFDLDRVRFPYDELRPLTPGGIERFSKAVEELKSRIERPDAMFTSPLLRTRQTAQILTDIARWPTAEDQPALAPVGDPAGVFNFLNQQSHARIALVGHEPNLSELASAALGGSSARISIEMKKGSLLCLDFPGRARPGGAALRWLLPNF